jgi:hypothetical protein
MPNDLHNWIAGTALLTVACVTLAICQPVFTGTWIINSKTGNEARALVLTLGMIATGPLVKIREVRGADDERLYEAIYEAAANPRVGRAAPLRMSHIGGAESWCDDKNCHRLYLFVASARRIRDFDDSAACHSQHPSVGCTLGQMNCDLAW